MIAKLLPMTHKSEETLKRSLVKTISYRVVILILDFVSIYLLRAKQKLLWALRLPVIFIQRSSIFSMKECGEG